MNCRAFMRRNADLKAGLPGASSPFSARHPEARAPQASLRSLRKLGCVRASKDARPRLTATASISAARRPFGIFRILSPSSHHLSFPRGVERADRLVSWCRPRTRGAAERREAHTGSSITLARRDAALTTRSHPGATGTTPLGAPPWRFPAAGPRFNSGSVHRIHVATCPPARSQDLTDWVPYLPRRDSHPLATGRHASLRLVDRLRRRPS
jgi:hypothetical protein